MNPKIPMVSRLLVPAVLLIGVFSGACDRVTHAPAPAATPGTPAVALAESPAERAARERQLAETARADQAIRGVEALMPAESRALVAARADAEADDVTVSARVRVGVLYFLDRPAHRLAVRQWLEGHGGKVLFDSERFGYMDAELTWGALAKMVATVGQLGLDESSFLKLELEDVKVGKANAEEAPRHLPADPADGNSSFFGGVHEAGYGAKVAEFRRAAARDLGVAPAALTGKGSLVAVFDSGLDLSRTDVFQNRVRDVVIGEERVWQDLGPDLHAWMGREGLAATPEGLADVAANPSLRIASLKEATYGFDVNGSGRPDDEIAVAVYETDGHWEARLRPAKGLAFGDATRDFGEAHAAGLPQIVNAYTGKHYVRAAVNPSPSAVGFKFRRDADGKAQVAFVGLGIGGEHGIANLHMVGGDYVDRASRKRYQGVAPEVEFIMMQTWHTNRSNYGESWVPLARTMIQAAEAGADVIDLDIYTPGSRRGQDLLSNLACRITASTDAVPVVAAHNYGSLPDTVQSLAQSPCVLGIGASHTRAALREGRRQGIIDPALRADDDPQTAEYSGRGFALNGLLKPDVISPAYAYTAYGATFTRFAGTSGATPATAGMIVLLKQAAALKKIALGFDQVRFLLQGASRAPKAARDGYGFTDLAATWKLFLSYVGRDGTFGLSPVVLAGHGYLGFEGRPDRSVVTVKLTRQAVKGSVDTPMPFRFSIEYAGASRDLGVTWLKFYDTAVSDATDALAKDIPMHGESQDLRLYFALDDATWAKLPPGDHIAIVKGVRPSVARGRAVDFLLPVAFTKGKDVANDRIAVKPLYADQNDDIALTARPGDQFLVYGHPVCLGERLPTTGGEANADGFVFVADNEAFYSHASAVMNGYAYMVLGEQPIRVEARKNLVRLNVRRRGLVNCDGPVGGDIQVRRISLRAHDETPSLAPGADGTTVGFATQLTLAGAALGDEELVRQTVWNAEAGDAKWLLRKTITADTRFVVPEGTLALRVVPQVAKHFQGVVALVKDGDVKEFQATTSQDFAGFASPSYVFADRYMGLNVVKPAAGSEARIYLAGSSEQMGTPVTVELDVTAAGAAKLSAFPKDVKAWALGESKALRVEWKAPLKWPANLSSLGEGWRASVSVPYTIKETMQNGSGTVRYEPLDVWRGSFATPLLFP